MKHYTTKAIDVKNDTFYNQIQNTVRKKKFVIKIKNTFFCATFSM